MFMYVFVAVYAVVKTGACVYQFDIAFDEQQWEYDIADATGQPDGDEQYNKDTDQIGQ